MTSIVDAYQQIFSDKKKIMAVFAHPDDLEIMCGGLIARLVADGKEVCSIKVTSGDMGSRQEKISQTDLKSAREIEDSVAMKILGIKSENNIYLRLPDGRVENTVENIGKIVEQIRIFQPDLIITHNPEVSIVRFDKDNSWFNHRDHRTTGQLTFDAAYPYSRDLLFFPEHFQNPKAKSWACDKFLVVDSYDHADSVYIDVTKFVDKRVQAQASHQTQYNLESAQEMADFFTKQWDKDKNYETFRLVIAD
jgi:LmbE family N-acetylglucosaminyl deacetylase